MSYLIDARLERGAPTLTLIDAETGKQRLHWRCEHTASPETAWQSLFQRLALLSCADRFSLIYRTTVQALGQECIGCNTCDEQVQTTARHKPLVTTLKKNVIPLQELPQ